MFVKKIIKSSLLAFVMVGLLSGCTSQNGPSIDLLLHGKTSHAKVTKNFDKISTDKKIFVKDITKRKDLYAKHDPAYSQELGIPSTTLCAIDNEIREKLKKAGYTIVKKESDADYLIFSESIGCGTWIDIKNHLHKPDNIGKYIDNVANSEALQNSLSEINLSSSLNQTGHTGASVAVAAIGILSMFGPSDSYSIKMLSAITIVDKGDNKVQRSIIYTNCYGNYMESALANGRTSIADRFQMEVTPVGLLGI